MLFYMKSSWKSMARHIISGVLLDHEDEGLEAFVTKRRDRKAALIFLKKIMKQYGKPHVCVTDRLRSYHAAMKLIGNKDTQEVGC